GKAGCLWLHRFIMNTPKGMYTDHINFNKLDCRKENLRICTYAQNNQNRKLRIDSKHRYKGVGFNKRYGKWYSRITFNSKRRFLGSFLTEELAAQAYNKAAKIYYKNFAVLNVV